jgi:acyl-coenzyme A thioesterase PaaI-like protein
MAMDYLAPARATDLIGNGRVLRSKSLVNCEADVLRADGDRVAKAIASDKLG